MKSTGLTEEQMKLIGQIVSENTTIVNFDFLSKRIYEHGHTVENPGNNKTVFHPSVHARLLGFVQTALSEPDSVFAKDETRILFIKDLGEYIGYEQASVGQPQTVWRQKIGVLIDLQYLPENTAMDEDLALVADKIALIVAYPTR